MKPNVPWVNPEARAQRQGRRILGTEHRHEPRDDQNNAKEYDYQKILHQYPSTDSPKCRSRQPTKSCSPQQTLGNGCREEKHTHDTLDKACTEGYLQSIIYIYTAMFYSTRSSTA